MTTVAISGLGLIHAGASALPGLWALLARGASALSKEALFGMETAVAVGRVLEIPDACPALDPRTRSRTALLAAKALADALEDAGIENPKDLGKTALYVGTSTSGMTESEIKFEAMSAPLAPQVWGEQEIHGLPGGRYPSKLSGHLPPARPIQTRIDYDFWRMHPAGSVADALASGFGLGGPRITVSAACVSSAQAIALALWSIRSGKAEVAIAGGADALCRLTFFGFRSLKVMDDEVCRPFHKGRSGMNLGEGAAFLVLEPLERVLARGKRPHALLLGAGLSCDSHHMTQPDPEARGAEAAIRSALEDARLDPGRVGYINAHGTATLQNDAMEAKAVSRVFGSGSDAPYVSSSKPVFGHTLGAAGAIEAAVTVMAIQHGFAPPTLGLEDPDPECGIRHVPKAGIEASIDAALSSSFAFGGLNAVLAFGKGEP